MKDYKLQPKNRYMRGAPLESLIEMTEFWKSELEFYGFEIKFLQDMINKYFILMTKQEDIAKVQDMLTDLLEYEKKQKELLVRIKDHYSDTGLLLDKAFYESEQKVRRKQAVLENKVALFIRDLKKLKSTIFGITKHVLESEKLQHLLTT